MTDEITWPSWAANLRDLPRDVAKAALLDTFGKLEAAGYLLSTEMMERCPDAAPFLSEIESIDSWQTKIVHFLDRMEKVTMAKQVLTGERPVDQLRSPPAEGWQLRVLGPALTFGNRQFPHNSVLPNDILASANSAALLRSGRIAWTPPGPPGPKPRGLPPSATAKRNPKVEVIVAGNGLDEIETLRLTYHEMIRRCGGNTSTARDLIIGDRAANEIYLRASKLDYDRQRRAGAVIGGVKTIWERISS